MRKRITTILIFIICVLALFGCGSKSTVGNSGGGFERMVSADKIDENLRFFLGVNDATPLGDMGNRTPTSESERNAAEKLYMHFSSDEYANIEVTPLEETEFEVSVGNTKRSSQNVEIRFKGNGNNVKQIIIGAGYDNPYGAYNEEYSASQPSTGAFDNATGVATVMSLIDYCNENADEINLDFDIVFVFFGCSNYNSMGAREYANGMEPAEKLNTLLMMSVSKLGGDKMYLYTGEVKTEHESFLRGVATELGSDYNTLPMNMPIIDGIYLDDVYYAHFGMLGDHAAFMDWDIPSAYVFSGAYGGFNLSDLESKGDSNLGGTKDDTYANLRVSREDFAAQGSDTANLILTSVKKEGFAAAMQTSRLEKKDYSFWTSPLWAYLIVIFVIIALCIVLIIVVKYLEKKYPYAPPRRRMKIAVFGMDYETKSDGDIFVDIKKPSDPFDGY